MEEIECISYLGSCSEHEEFDVTRYSVAMVEYEQILAILGSTVIRN